MNSIRDVTTTSATELREDVPLKSTGKHTFGGRLDKYFDGIKFIILCFGALTAAITIALLTQIYHGDYELIPHGSVATDSDVCSSLGTSILKRGGSSIDAAIASTLCLTVVAPHITGLDGGGVMMLYDYRMNREFGPTVIDFRDVSNKSSTRQYPRLISGLAHLHKMYGSLPWKDVVKPSADLARSGFSVSHALVTSIDKYNATNLFGPLRVDQNITMTSLSNYLNEISNADTNEITQDVTTVVTYQAIKLNVNNFYLHTPKYLSINISEIFKSVHSSNDTTEDYNFEHVVYRLASSIQKYLMSTIYKNNITNNIGVGTNVAVIGVDNIYVSLVSGMSKVFGSRKLTEQSYILDNINTKLNLIPTMLTETRVCGRRMIMGSTDITTIIQVITNLIYVNETLFKSIELPRFKYLDPFRIAIESERQPKYTPIALNHLKELGELLNITEPYTSCNIVLQDGDSLMSHSDSRGGGIASRF